MLFPRLRELLGHVNSLVQAYAARCVWLAMVDHPHNQQVLVDLGVEEALQRLWETCALHRGKYFARKALQLLAPMELETSDPCPKEDHTKVW